MSRAAASPLITCPQCGHAFQITDAIAHDLEEKYRAELSQKMAELRASAEKRESEMRAREQEMEKQRLAFAEKVSLEVEKSLSEREAQLKKQATEQLEIRLKAMADELAEKNVQVAKATKLEIENERLKRDAALQEEKIRLSLEKEIADRVGKQNEELRMKEREQAELRVRERDELVTSLRDQINAMKQKAEQGSTERQGEIQELVITDWLRETFPGDLVEDIRKGQRGADVLLTVRTPTGRVAGKIYFESKRTATFSRDWIDKLKQDNLEKKADLLVLVTQALPDEGWRVADLDGVWVCAYFEFKAAAVLLRQSLIAVAGAVAIQSNSGDKMKLLYDYLVSLEFRQQMENILGGFTELEDGYRREKQQMEKIWKQREKQLERILTSTNHFIGAIQGIAGAAIPALQQIGEPTTGE